MNNSLPEGKTDAVPTLTITEPIHKATSDDEEKAESSQVAQEQIDKLKMSMAVGDRALANRIQANRVLVKAPQNVAVRAVPVDCNK